MTTNEFQMSYNINRIEGVSFSFHYTVHLYCILLPNYEHVLTSNCVISDQAVLSPHGHHIGQLR